MNAPPFPLNPNVGQWWDNWVWNGARWVAASTAGLRQNIVTFYQSGPYMPSPGLASVMVECVGGGGAGGGVTLTNATWALGGGGGGAGSYGRRVLPAALVRGGVLVTVGQGGASVEGGNGGNGGATSFGALCVANGGYGGGGNDAGASIGWGAPGAGGEGDIADFSAGGNPGSPGSTDLSGLGGSMVIYGGGGGGSLYGGGAPATYAGGGSFAAGHGGSTAGSGGGGGVTNMVTGEATGGPGSVGVCIVTEYCWGDRDQLSPEWRPPVWDVNVNLRPQPGPPCPPGPWPPGWRPQPREFEALDPQGAPDPEDDPYGQP